MIKKEANNKARVRRHERVRKVVTGTKDMPRLNVLDLIKVFMLKLLMM